MPNGFVDGLDDGAVFEDVEAFADLGGGVPGGEEVANVQAKASSGTSDTSASRQEMPI